LGVEKTNEILAKNIEITIEINAKFSMHLL